MNVVCIFSLSISWLVLFRFFNLCQFLFCRCKISDFYARMERLLIKRRKPVPILAMLIVNKPLSTMAVIISIYIALVQAMTLLNGQHHQPPKTNQHSICNEPNQVSFSRWFTQLFYEKKIHPFYINWRNPKKKTTTVTAAVVFLQMNEKINTNALAGLWVCVFCVCNRSSNFQ